MAKNPICLVCTVPMVQGFLTDLGDMNTIHLPRWCEGDPKSSFWTGEARQSQRKQGLRVVAYRCPMCEALRLYAPSDAS